MYRPARSTSLRQEVRMLVTPSSVHLLSSTQEKTQWERLESVLALVAATCRFPAPLASSCITSSAAQHQQWIARHTSCAATGHASREVGHTSSGTQGRKPLTLNSQGNSVGSQGTSAHRATGNCPKKGYLVWQGCSCMGSVTPVDDHCMSSH